MGRRKACDPPRAGGVVASKWSHAPTLAEAILDTFKPAGDRLENLPLMLVDDLCAAIGCESHNVCRWEFARVLEWTTDGRIYGHRVAAGDVFGTPREAAGERRAA